MKYEYEWLMNVSYYRKYHKTNQGYMIRKCTEFKGDEFNDAEIKDICRIMNFVDVEFKKRLPSAADVILTHKTTYSPGQLRFTITSKRQLTDEEVQIIEHIVGSNLGMSVYHLNTSLYRLDVEIFPEWDDAVLSCAST
jgi:hypothetical protein